MPSEPQNHPLLSWPVIGLILIIVAGLGWWIIREEPAPSAVAVAPPPKPPVAASKKPQSQTDAGSTPAVQDTPPPLAAAVPQEDEAKIHAWLTEIDDTNEIAAAMLAGWKQLSESGRIAAAPHLLNLVTDERFNPVSDILMNPATNNEVKSILFAGVLNRGDEVKWPLILRVMEQKDHPNSQEARNMLIVVLGKDLGDDWPAWREQVQTQLLKQTQPLKQDPK